MARIQYDERDWPIVRIITPEHAPTDDELEAHFQALDELTMERLVRRYSGVLAGQALVIRSAIQRGVITAITWAFSPPYDTRVFAEPDTAERWLRSLLDRGASATR